MSTSDTEKKRESMNLKLKTKDQKLAGAGLLGLFAGLTLGFVLSGEPQPNTVSPQIAEKIEKAFPKTKFVDFNQTEFGLIEGVTASNIFYFDQDVRTAFIGEVLDIENKIAVTQERKKQIARFADLDIAGSPANTASEKPSPPAKAAPQKAGDVIQVDMTGFPAENYIVHNAGAGTILYVVSDFNCGFCKKLNDQLKNVTDIEIREIPVMFLGQDSGVFGSHALCADDPAAASQNLFDGQRSNIVACTRGDDAVRQNTEWAQSVGIGGTPALIREDGRASSGFRELPLIMQFLGA